MSIALWLLSCVTVILLLQIQNIQLEREMALAANRSLAEQNLDMKPRLETERARLVGKYAELEEVREKYKQHCAMRGKGKDESIWVWKVKVSKRT